MNKQVYVLAAAIVLAGALVGLGVFLGLRSEASSGGGSARGAGDTAAPISARPPATAPHAANDRDPAAAAGPTGAAPPAAPSVVAAPGAPALPIVLAPDEKTRVDQRISEQLVRQKPALARACYAPSVAASAAPPSLEVAIRFLFDPSGKQLYLSIADAPDPRRSDVIECLRKQNITLTIDPMPGNVTGAAVLTFP